MTSRQQGFALAAVIFLIACGESIIEIAWGLL